MDLDHLRAALASKRAYAHPVDDVQVLQTHISMVFLAGEFAYKIKKPVQLGFLDFSTLELRKQYCQQEVELNRRLAEHVYLGVVPVTRENADLQFEGKGEIVEWAVKMVRLPEEATLAHQLTQATVPTEAIQALGQRLAKFHNDAPVDPRIAEFGFFSIVAANMRENFSQTRSHIGYTVHQDVFDRCELGNERLLEQLHDVIQSRAHNGYIKDTHGDLRLDHVYLFPDRLEPENIVIIDCIEFNNRFRYADPLSDLAFLVMDLLLHGYDVFARELLHAYTGKPLSVEMENLMRFYIAYRALVRAKVEGITALEREVVGAEKEMAIRKAKAHWLLALLQLVPAEEKPCLILIGGLPGTGKSTLARAVAEEHDFEVLRTDVIRKAFPKAKALLSPNPGEGLYSSDWNEKTYAECARQAADFLFTGKRVIVDASFREEKRRRQFIDLGISWGVPVYFWHCHAPSDIVEERLRQRVNDASDADVRIYEYARQNWEPISAETMLRTINVDCSGVVSEILQQVERNLANFR